MSPVPSQADINKVAEDLIEKVEQICAMPQQIVDKYDDVARSLFVRLVLRISEKIVEWGQKFADAVKRAGEKLVEILKGIAAPGFFIATSFDWADVSTTASTLGADLQSEKVTLNETWAGTGATAYRTVTPSHSAAAARIGTMANTTRLAMLQCGIAGVAFYASALAAASVFITEVIAEVAAAGTGVGAIPAAIAGVLSTTKVITLITVALTALSALILAQVNNIQNVDVEARSGLAFPDGAWPKAATGRYDDATVLDGDADWSTNTGN